MCNFVSWVEFEKKNYFLTDKDLESKEGKSLIKFLGSSFQEDIKGHGAIRTYFNGGGQENGKKLQWGKECENSDLSSPANFPAEIVIAIKKGRMTRIGYSVDLLNEKGKAKYEEVEGPALAKYEEVEGQALAKYEEVKGPAWAKYEEVEGQAWAKYQEVQGQAFWKIFSQEKYRNPLWV